MAVKLLSELKTTRDFENVLDTMLPTPVLLEDAAAVTLTKAANQGRVNVVGMISQASTYTIPAPAAAGEYYKFVNAFTAEEGDDVAFSTGTGGGVFMKGSIAHLDTNADNAAIYSDGDSNELLTLVDPGPFEINFLSKSTTEWYIWGYVLSEDVPTIAD
tara:strand:- start:92 stop:568 length:477 start_codon:yes stop_codon:yes gene_type:complete